jgi:hypothetical protein
MRNLTFGVTSAEFIARVTSHIPDKGQVMLRIMASTPTHI